MNGIRAPRVIRYVLVACACLGVIFLFLLATASANTALFARSYNLLLVLNFTMVAGLMGLVGYQLLRLRKQHKAGVFGSRLAARLVLFFALTALYWTLTAAALGILARGFGFNSLTPLMLAVMLTIQVVGAMVPAGPGMVGTMQFFTQAGLSLFDAGGFSARGAAFANTVWLLQFVVQVGLGVIFLVAGHVSLKGLFGATAAEGDATAPAAS